VFPALQASSSRGEHLLARASRTSAAVSPRRARRVLMAAEVALALVLLVGCGLMIRTMRHLAAVDPGFRVDRLLTARVVLSGDSWNDRERRIAFHDRLLEAVRAVPGVIDAALTLSLPIEGSQWGSVFIVSGKPIPATADLPSAAFIPISDRYFQTMDIAVKSGRGFDKRDGADAEKVIVVNETLARRLWPGENAVGQRLKQGFPGDANPWREVIGVAADVKLQGVDQSTPMQVFLPLAQEPSRSIAIAARTAVEPGSLGVALESAVHRIQADLPVLEIAPMTTLMQTAVAIRRLSTTIFSVFAFVAVMIAAVGLYGVISHSVTERTREIGVRMALGAERRRILLLFTGQGLMVAAVGTIIGVAGALALSRWLSQLVFGVEPTDPVTFVLVAGLVLAIAALACYVPARRATRIDPLAALRTE